MLTIENFVISNISREASAEFNEGPAPDEVIEPAAEGEEPLLIPEEGEVPVVVPAPEEGEVVPAGPVPVVEPAKRKDEMPSKVVEVVESTVTTKETVAKAEPEAKAEVEAKVDVEAKCDDAEAKADDAEAKVDAEAATVTEAVVEAKKEDEVEMVAKADVEARFKAYDARIEALENKLVNFVDFESKTVEAIDLLASNSTSNFKPAAKAKVAELKQAGSGSIFGRAKAQRGL